MKFVVNFDSGKPLDADIVERLMADKGIGRLTLSTV
jgi:hypothetical protein